MNKEITAVQKKITRGILLIYRLEKHSLDENAFRRSNTQRMQLLRDITLGLCKRLYSIWMD